MDCMRRSCYPSSGWNQAIETQQLSRYFSCWFSKIRLGCVDLMFRISASAGAYTCVTDLKHPHILFLSLWNHTEMAAVHFLSLNILQISGVKLFLLCFIYSPLLQLLCKVSKYNKSSSWCWKNVLWQSRWSWYCSSLDTWHRVTFFTQCKNVTCLLLFKNGLLKNVLNKSNWFLHSQG